MSQLETNGLNTALVY